MDQVIMERLSAQDRVLSAILAALAPAEETGPGLGDLIEALSELTAAVAMQSEEIRSLRSAVSGAYPSSMAGPSRAA